ncbi:MAG: glycosyltransferase [Alphaproteobacteria bacterium]|nr:glycosyltransferase [Alphaproteobacteria bacterium]
MKGGLFGMPKVSVLTPIYNTNPLYLRECIDSVLRQTFTDFEFIILNDSPENTDLDEIVESYLDNRIKYIKNNTNIGISKSRNKLIDLATGEYLAIFDHDDISRNTRLEEQVRFLDNNPYVGVVGAWAQWFGARNFIRKNPEYDTDIKIYLTDRCAIMHTCAMIRKSVLMNNNIRYEEQYSPAEDYRLWGRLMHVTNFHNIPNVLVDYRCDTNNTSHRQKTKMNIAHKSIQMQICNTFPMYRMAFEQNMRKVRFRLFGKIPLIKIKNKWALLFDCIPIIKIKD